MRFLSRLRIFKRLREMELWQRTLLETDQARFDCAIEILFNHTQHIASVMARFQGPGRLIPCPHCGAALWELHPGTGKYRAPNGSILCCIQCRAFMKETLVRIKQEST